MMSIRTAILSLTVRRGPFAARLTVRQKFVSTAALVMINYMRFGTSIGHLSVMALCEVSAEMANSLVVDHYSPLVRS